MGRDAFESLAMSVFVCVLMWHAASHRATPAPGSGAVAKAPAFAEVRDAAPLGELARAIAEVVSREPADTYSAGGYWDWMEQQHAMP